METIYKYPLYIQDVQTLQLPKGAEILCVQTQMQMPYLWAIVDPEVKEKEDVVVRTIGTSHEFRDGAELLYVGTYQLPSLVFHVFIKQ
jgi:hypothetical protein